MAIDDYRAQAERLANLSEGIDDVAPQENTYQDAPDGRYICRVHSVGLRTSAVRPDGTGGNDYLNWDLVIAQGQYEGQHLFHVHMLQTPKNQAWLKADLGVLGAALPPFDRERGTGGLLALQDVQFVRSLLDRVIEVKKETRRDDPKRYNLYFVRPASAATNDGGPPF